MFLYSAKMKDSNEVDFYLCKNDKDLEKFLIDQYEDYYLKDIKNIKRVILEETKIWKHNRESKIKGLYNNEGNKIVINVSKILHDYSEMNVSGYVGTFYTNEKKRG